MSEVSKSDEALVYHYTTADGLKGIIENRCLWATSVNFLNDFSEYEHGLKIVIEEINRFKVSKDDLIANGIEPTESNINSFSTLISQIASSRLGDPAVTDIKSFVASFFHSPSELEQTSFRDAGDILEQWRAYSRGGPGFSIGFSKSKLG
jgi:hypothetical protein